MGRVNLGGMVAFFSGTININLKPVLGCSDRGAKYLVVGDLPENVIFNGLSGDGGPDRLCQNP